jgi:hypothetical protein
MAVVLLMTAFGFKTATASTDKDTKRIEKVHAKILKVGQGPRARVEITLRDNTKLKGYVSETKADTFTVTDSRTGVARSVAYADVQEVWKPGSGMSKRGWIILGASAAAAAIVGLVLWRKYYCNEQPC